MSENLKLPKGWTSCLLEEVCKFKGGGTPSKSRTDYWGGNIPWASIKDISQVDYIQKTQDFITEEGLKNSSATIVNIGDIIIGTRLLIGKPVIAKIKTAINQDLKVVNTTLSKKFLFYWFKNQSSVIESLSSGTTVKGIRLDRLKKIEIVLPPSTEQDRIVAKVDILMAQVATMQKSLARIPQLLKDFRQQVLTQAVTGKLTEEWRQGKTEKHWQKRTLKEVAFEIFDGPFGSNLKTKDYISSGIQVVRLENIKSMYYDDSKKAYVSQEKYDSLSRNHLKAGDLLLSTFIANDIRATILPESATPSINKSDVMCIRLNERILLKKFCLYFLVSAEGKEQIENLAHGMTRPRINTGNLRSIQPPIPPVKEQIEIIRQVENLFSKAEIIDKQYDTLKTKIDTLPQAILHKAFKGELVEQLPSDGDAKALLREIEGLKIV